MSKFLESTGKMESKIGTAEKIEIGVNNVSQDPLGGGASNEEDQKKSDVPSGGPTGCKVPGSEEWDRMFSLINSKVLKMTPLGGGASNEEDQKNREEECPICLEPKKDEVKTTCGHIFCNGCITEALKLNPECPLCRTVISIQTLKPVIEKKVCVASVSSSGAASTRCLKNIPSYDFDDDDLFEYYNSDDDDHSTSSTIIANIMANGGDFGDHW